MQRCLQLAAMGAGKVAPNPMVGAVLVSDARIIGEGYHQKYGEAHAEVNCINSVADTDKHLISRSALYVSLEPCAHFGKTPPCADLIIKNKIPNVIIGCRDSFAEVDGRGIERLKTAGINVRVGILEKECRELNKRFFTFHEKRRPYIILKWAQSNNGKIGGEGSSNYKISNEFTDRLVHQWRTEEAAILVGTNTARLDDPALTARLWPGSDPLRLVIDLEIRLPGHLKLFDGSTKTIVFTYQERNSTENLVYHQLNRAEDEIPQILSALHDRQVQSLIVEGGTKLLQSFIDAGLWDEARVITNTNLLIDKGLDAPVLKNSQVEETQKLINDIIEFRSLEKNYK
ncbi:MAG: bifunctional diaminohydroxyphosphoribosylaminopyrimidine deaminase/5-amino-6-(5-phosphoribosylamino)uracil reductase RibD [Ferruginibacter sp.]|nr:bifunctional diaminohydroxyphosphoribosylaminopyrimidine deaminase/5-amino-6-(5-phosphoribosylamino)uracil reductase RibD [Ferruginibacter sp.]